MIDSTPGALRSADLADFEAIHALERACFGTDDGIFNRRQLRRLLRNPRAHWRIGADGRAVACWLRAGNGRTRWARLYSLAVHPSVRGHGWAQRLLADGEEWMRTNRLGCVRAEVKLDNHRARALYARAGFREIEVLPEYYTSGCDGLRLEKRLAGPVRPMRPAPGDIRAAGPLPAATTAG